MNDWVLTVPKKYTSHHSMIKPHCVYKIVYSLSLEPPISRHSGSSCTFQLYVHIGKFTPGT